MREVFTGESEDDRSARRTDEHHQSCAPSPEQVKPTSGGDVVLPRPGPAANATTPPTRRKRKSGRPALLTRERHDAIRHLSALGFTRELVARFSGIGTSTLQMWLATGNDASVKRDAGKKLTEHEEACLELFEDIGRLVADKLATSEEMLWALATNHRKTKVVQTKTQLANKNGLVLDAHGQPVWVETIRHEITDEPSIRAALYNQHRLSARAAQIDEVPNNEPKFESDPVSTRLANLFRSMPRPEPDPVDEEFLTDLAPPVGPRVPLTTDDIDSATYIYAPWVGSLFSEHWPETLETPETG